MIEDIDCSLDLTGERKNKKTKEKKKDHVKKGEEEEEKQSKVTVSWLLNVIVGIWTVCGGEKLIIFTTNHKETEMSPADVAENLIPKYEGEKTEECLKLLRKLKRKLRRS